MTFTPQSSIGELETDILKRTVRAGTSELRLTSLEQSLLYLLAANAGRSCAARLTHNAGPKPFVWVKPAEESVAGLARFELRNF